MADKPQRLFTATLRPLPAVVVMAIALLVCLTLVPWAFTLLRPTPTAIIGAAQYLVLLAAVLPLMRWKSATPAETPPSKAAAIDPVSVAMIATLVMFAISIFTGWLAQILGLVPQAALTPKLPVSAVMRWTEFLILVALGPAAEEIAFRGFLLGSLRHWRFGFWPAAVLTTMAWMLMHAPWSAYAVVVYFGLGMTLSWVLLRTGLIWPCVLAHTAYNAVPARLVLFYLD